MTTKIPVELSSTPGISDSSNATAITIDSSENVGIATTSPAQKLHVTGNIYAGAGNYFTDATSGYFFGGSGSFTNGVYGVGTNNMAFNTNGSERMRIAANGNITTGGANISVFTGTSSITLADDATYSINSSGTGGAALLTVYEAGSGDNALFHVGYNGSVVVSSQNNAIGFSATDTDGKLCVIKVGHSLTFKNRSGSTRTFYLSAYGGGNTGWNL